MTETCNVNAVAVPYKEAEKAEEVSVAAGYRANREGRAQRNWYARFDPATAESLSYEQIK